MTGLAPEAAAPLALAARAFAMLLFATSAWSKTRQWTTFTTFVGQYRVLPIVLTLPAAATVLALEAAVACGVLVPVLAPLATQLGVALLIGFGGAMAINLARGNRDIDCGCFGSARRQRLDWWLVARNILFAALLVPGTAQATYPEGAADWIDGIGMGIAVFILAGVASALVALREPAAAFQRRFA